MFPLPPRTLAQRSWCPKEHAAEQCLGSGYACDVLEHLFLILMLAQRVSPWHQGPSTLHFLSCWCPWPPPMWGQLRLAPWGAVTAAHTRFCSAAPSAAMGVPQSHGPEAEQMSLSMLGSWMSCGGALGGCSWTRGFASCFLCSWLLPYAILVFAQWKSWLLALPFLYLKILQWPPPLLVPCAVCSQLWCYKVFSGLHSFCCKSALCYAAVWILLDFFFPPNSSVSFCPWANGWEVPRSIPVLIYSFCTC